MAKIVPGMSRFVRKDSRTVVLQKWVSFFGNSSSSWNFLEVFLQINLHCCMIVQTWVWWEQSIRINVPIMYPANAMRNRLSWTASSENNYVAYILTCHSNWLAWRFVDSIEPKKRHASLHNTNSVFEMGILLPNDHHQNSCSRFSIYTLVLVLDRSTDP